MLTRSGYGEQARFALRALRTREDLFDVYLKPIEWGKSSWLLPNDKDRGWLDALVRKTQFHAQTEQNMDYFDISFYYD